MRTPLTGWSGLSGRASAPSGRLRASALLAAGHRRRSFAPTDTTASPSPARWPTTAPYMAGASVYVLPIRFGAGVRVKLLNAMSMACASRRDTGRLRGHRRRGWHAPHRAPAHADRFAAAVLRLLDDPARQRALGGAARAHMRATYDWALCTPAITGRLRSLGAR